MSQRSRPDHFSRKAKAQGYPARSVFKLQEIQKRFRVLSPGARVLDVGAAPGSWTLFSLRSLKKGGSVTAVDLKPLSIKPPVPGKLRFYQGDIFSPEAAAFLGEGGPYNTILSDAAPSTTGNRLVDTRRSYDLVTRVLDLAEKYQDSGGSLVIKIFQGGDEKEILEKIQGLYKEVKAFKPQAVRSESFEIYFIGKKFKFPSGEE